MRMLATALVLLLGGAIAAAPPLPPRVKNADLPKVIHTCRMIVIRGPAGPQMVPYPIPVPAPAPPPAAPPVFLPPPAPVPPPGPDPATLALLHQILANQTTVLQHLAAIRATPAAPPCGGGSGVIVVPADGSPPAVVPVPVPTPSVTPSPTPPPFTLPPGAAPPFTLPPGSAPPIALPPGSAPPMTLPPGAAPPFTLPPGSAPPAKAAPTMPPADSISAAPAPMPQRYTVYMRYTMYEPARRRYVYVFIPQSRPNVAPAVTETREKSTFTPASKKR